RAARGRRAGRSPGSRGTGGGGPMSKTVVVLGARNLGSAIIDHFVGLGWNAVGVARSSDTLERVRERGALAMEADASDPTSLRASGGGTLVQITGGSSRRAFPGRGLWAAGAFATRALVQAAAQELRAHGIHVALLAVDATIESPKTAAFTRDVAPEALADMSE